MDKVFVVETIEHLNWNLLLLEGSNVRNLLKGLTIYPKTKKELTFCGRKIILAVIGESHFLLIEGVLMELLVCKILPAELFAGILRLDQIFGQKLKSCHCHCRIVGLNYVFDSSFIPYGSSKPIEFCGPELYKCEEDFPFILDKKKIPCQTRLHLSQIDPKTLCLQTSHDYPYPDKVTVLTKTTINFLSS